jgi:predicted alpha/beta superfamily hydrolase
MKRVIKYFSGFDQIVLRYRIGAGAFQETQMTQSGAGRTEGEYLWAAEIEAPDGAVVQFSFSDGVRRDPANRYYETAWFVTYVCDGEIFDYSPEVDNARVAPSQKAYDPGQLPRLFSKALGREVTYRVYLPRGYRQNASRRYPVLYMLDGQNVFENSGYGSWQAKESLDRLIRRGQIPELIVVAVDSGMSRMKDYVPPEDGGQADLFAKFLAEELKPYIDSTLRTKPGREHNGIIGSSLGGVLSLYTGWKYFHRFGRIGSMSGSWWLKGFRDSLPAQRKRPLTVYLDSGDSGYAADCVGHTRHVRDILEGLGFELGTDLHHAVGHRDEHNEGAWSRRLPHALRFLFPAA